VDRVTYAKRALFVHLRDYLPDALATLDASRQAVVVCGPQNYTITSGDTLYVNDGGFTLTAGTRTAAQVATDLAAATDFTASADSDGHLVLTADDTPTQAVPSALRIGAGTANEALGLQEKVSDRILLALSDPAPQLYERAWMNGDDIGPGLTVYVMRELEAPVVPHRTDIYTVSLRCELGFVGPAGASDAKTATLEALRAAAFAVLDVVKDGDGRGEFAVGGTVYGANVINCFPRPTNVEPAVGSLGDPSRGVTLARANLEFEVQVWDP
jgi:hypothetical protein